MTRKPSFHRTMRYLALCIFFFAIEGYNQINVSGQLQYQLGNLPETKPANRSSLYNQLNLQYFTDHIGIGIRTEYFKTDQQNEYYGKIQQKFVRYQNEALEIQAGNFYETLGRGLLLRTYEIPGVIYEEPGSRQRYGFYKDVEGFLVKYHTGLFSVKLLYGSPLDLLQPPSRKYSQRRPTLVQGGEFNLLLTDYLVPGVLFLRSDHDGQTNEFGGINLGGNLLIGAQYYLEYVTSPADQNPLLRLGNEGRHAFYGSVSQIFPIASFSIEIKDYHDFSLNFNDPPSLIREQPRTLLNRGIHSIQPQDERGYQIEGIFNVGDLNTITANHSRTINDFEHTRYNFFEYYIDLNYYLTSKTLTKGFLDYAEDEVINALNRWTTGLVLEQELPSLWATTIDLQYQFYQRNYEFSPEFNHRVRNYFFDLSVSHAPDLAFGINLESTFDPLESNTFTNQDDTNYTHWLGYNLSYQYDQNHSFTLFYGERRGGNACSGGICYEVQPFKGFELRMNSIF